MYECTLLDGSLASKGMPDFGEAPSKTDVEALSSFVLYVAKAFRETVAPQTSGHLVKC